MDVDGKLIFSKRHRTALQGSGKENLISKKQNTQVFLTSPSSIPSSTQRNGCSEMSASGTNRNKNRAIQNGHQLHYPFWFGGSASCFAASVTHPLDLSMSFGYTREKRQEIYG
jgi:hypothetical protein